MQKLLGGVVLLITVLLLSSCSKDEKESKSMEQLYRENGIPVRTSVLETKTFMVERSYNAVLTGIEESSAYAKIDDKVEKVFVKVGDYVEEDQTLLTFPTNNPGAQYYQAKVAYENAKLAHDRIANMYKTGGVPKQQVDNVKANLDVAEANWDAAQQTVIVKAPIAGYVTKVNVMPTDNVKRDAELFTISRMNKMKARVWISENDATEIVAGMPANAIWNDIMIEGKVVEVDMALNYQKQAFGAVIEFANPGKILKFGITVDINIQTYKNPDALVVEMKDLIQEEGQYFVYVVENEQAVKKPVQVGKRHKLNVEILEGIRPGEQLVVEGSMLLEPGAKVRIIS